jgi:hypothetical protein
MHITFVKKRLASGAVCAQCREVEARLRASEAWARIDAVVEIDESLPEGDGAVLARQHGVRSAPFFIVREAGETRVYTRFAQFSSEVLARSPHHDDAGNQTGAC